MWNSIKREAELSISDLGIYALIELAIFVLGTVIMSIVTAFAAEVYFPMGTVLGIIVCVISTLFGNISTFGIRFDGAVTLGATRKKHLPGIYIVYFCMAVLLLTEIKILGLAENLLYGKLFPDVEGEIFFQNGVPFCWIVTGSLLILGISALVSATMRKFGKNAGVVWMLIWLVVCFTLPEAISGESKEGIYMPAAQLWKLFSGLDTAVQISVLCAAGLVFLGIAYGIMKKQAAS